MAIINSIVMGKSHGKIGNVVTTTLKGQVIAKARNFAPANPKSVLQTASRRRMSNAVLAWQYLSVFLAYISSYAKPVESTYNAFIRLTKNLFSDTIQATSSSAAGMLHNLSFGIAKLCTIHTVDLFDNSVAILFTTGGMPFSHGRKMRAISFDIVTGVNEISEIEITENVWNSGMAEIPFQANPTGSLYCYAYSAIENSCSNVKC